MSPHITHHRPGLRLAASAQRLSRALVALPLLLCACVAIPPTDVEVETFTVTGNNVETATRRIAQAHAAHVPQMHGNYWASVALQYDFDFEVYEVGGECRFNRDGTIGLSAKMALPEWRPPRRAAADDREKWQLIQSYAKIHEEGHIEIAERFARKLTAKFRALRAPNCEALSEKATAVLERLKAQSDAEHQRFDDTDGARFRRYLRRHGYVITDETS